MRRGEEGGGGGRRGRKGERSRDALDSADSGREGKWKEKVGGGQSNPPLNWELDGHRGPERGAAAVRVPSGGLESAPNQRQGCSRSGSELSPSELSIMKKHSARVAPLSACNSPVLTLTKVEGRGCPPPGGVLLVLINFRESADAG